MSAPATASLETEITPELSRKFLHYMLMMRELEDRIELKLYRQGKIVGGCYTGRGQEAIPVGATLLSEPNDYICPSHRDMGAFLIRGVTPREILAQYLGRATGLTGYIGAIATLTLLIVTLAVLAQAGASDWVLGAAAFLALLPASDLAIAIINRMVTKQRQPQCLPALSLKDGVPRGFLWPAGTGMERPDAWCVSCDDAVEATGGEWTEESEAEAGVTLLCAACYDRAKEMNKE